MSSYYVLVNRALLLENCVFNGDLLAEGSVVNGGWRYRNDGMQERACTDSGATVNAWPATPQRIVAVPEGKRGDYNAIISWAETQ